MTDPTGLEAVPPPSLSRTPSRTSDGSGGKLSRTSSRPRLAQKKSGGSAAGSATPAIDDSNMNGPLYMQTSGSSNVVLVRRRKRKDDGAWKQLMRWFVENQIGLSFNLLALLFLVHMSMPRAQSYTRKFFALSYHNPSTGRYAIGYDDCHFMAFCIVLFTGLRAGCMEYVLAPFGKWAGLKNRKDLTRFSEQAWLLIYYIVFWPLGMYLYVNSKYFLNLSELWTDWPDRELDGIMKFYVLAQWAFWLQQILVINIEERRKDHWQMFSHHIVTISLLCSCYSYHHTRVGNLILVLMDVVDLFLPVAKCLKYTGFTTLCDVMFGVFMVSWFVARHVLYIMVCWSIYAQTPYILPTGCFRGDNAHLQGPFPVPSGSRWLIEPFINPRGTVCYNETIKWSFLTPLLLLQVLTLVWFAMIVRVALRVLRGDGADDVRSDDEAGDDGLLDDEDEFEYEEAAPLEEEVGVEDLDLKGWERRSGVKRQSTSSSTGVSLPGHSDRKELLGRIGCEKQVD